MPNLAKLDAVTRAVIEAGLQQVCDEMDLTFSRAAFSAVIAEADGPPDGMSAAWDGALIAQGSRGLPVFVCFRRFSTRLMILRVTSSESAAPGPGNIYSVNDPYPGGTHLMVVRFGMPFWRDDRFLCWLFSTENWPNTGGAVPGGFSASATSSEQEGRLLAKHGGAGCCMVGPVLRFSTHMIDRRAALKAGLLCQIVSL